MTEQKALRVPLSMSNNVILVKLGPKMLPLLPATNTDYQKLTGLPPPLHRGLLRLVLPCSLAGPVAFAPAFYAD
jgi:hypothetical protein